MITFLVGKKSKSLDKAFEHLKEKADVSDVYRRDAESDSFGSFYDEVQSPSLFGEKFLFVVTNLFGNDAAKKEFLENGEALASAPHDIVVLLDSILAADTKKAEKFSVIEKVAEPKAYGSDFNAFALANAFATGDKKKTWVTFQEVLAHEDEMEKTHGMIWWKLKDMAQKKSSISDAALKDMARRLVGVYHESRLGGLGMKERLEEFFLTMPDIK